MPELLMILHSDDICKHISALLKDIGYDKECFKSTPSIEAVKQDGNQTILASYPQGQYSFSEWIGKLFDRFTRQRIIVIDREPNLDHAVYAISRGAQDYLAEGAIDKISLRKALNKTSPVAVLSANHTSELHEAPVPMFVFDNQTFKFLEVNNAALKQYGYTREEFIQLKATDIRPDTELGKFYQITQSLREIYLDAGPFTHKRKNGDLFYVHIYAHHTQFKGKSATVAVAIDIDKKVQAEAALRETTEDMLDILESISDAFFALDKEWRFTYVNKQFELNQNRSRIDLIGRNIWEIFPYAKTLKFYRKYKYALAKQVSVHFEEFNPQTNRWVSINAYPTRNGLAVYFRDISREKTVQEKIYNDDQNLRAIINNTSNIIWSVNKDREIITGNKPFWDRVSSITGKTIRKTDKNDYTSTDVDMYNTFYDRAFKNESFKTTIRSAVSEIKYEELSFNPICNQKNEVIGVTCFMRDVTEEYEYREKIKQQNEQLRKIAWLQSHKVRAPVANLLGLTQLLDLSAERDPESKEILQHIINAASQLDEIIMDITTRINGLDQ